MICLILQKIDLEQGHRYYKFKWWGCHGQRDDLLLSVFKLSKSKYRWWKDKLAYTKMDDKASVAGSLLTFVQQNVSVRSSWHELAWHRTPFRHSIHHLRSLSEHLILVVRVLSKRMKLTRQPLDQATAVKLLTKTATKVIVCCVDIVRSVGVTAPRSSKSSSIFYLFDCTYSSAHPTTHAASNLW